MARLLSVLFVFISIPLTVAANLEINEIAWMGIDGNANGEWIELINTGSDTVSLVAWTLISTSGTPSINLTGSIAPNGFYLLTRTNTSIIPGITGDQSYTGALSNSGTTLVLSDSGGIEIDRVEGGSNWSTVGGDNTTKETAQKVDGVWVTATPTPKAENTSISLEEEETEGEVLGVETGTTTPEATIGGSSITSGTGSYKLPKLYIVPGPSRIVSVHAETPFVARVFDEHGKEKKHTKVYWSFGDGIRQSGYTATHTYGAPGEYLVVVRAENKLASAMRTLVVRVEEPTIQIGEVTDLGIEVVHDGDTVMDISNWKLRVDGNTFIIPEDTALLPKGRVVFLHEITGLSDAIGRVQLETSGGHIIAEG